MKRHNYYFRQKVTEAELDQGFDYAENADHAISTDNSLVGILSGFGVAQHSPTPNLTVDVDGPGVAYDSAGQRVFFASLQNCDVSKDSDDVTTSVVTPGNKKYVSVALKFKRVESDPRLDGYGATVYFTEDESWEFVVRQGAEAGSPTPPPLETDTVLLADVLLTYGMTQVTNSDIFTDRRQEASTFSLAGRYAARYLNGPPLAAIEDLASIIDQHTSGTGFLHEGADLHYNGGNAWHDGTTNPATTVELQLDKIVSDLSADAGAAKIGDSAYSGNPYALASKSVAEHVGLLLEIANYMPIRAFGTIAGTGSIVISRGLHETTPVTKLGTGDYLLKLATPATTGLVCVANQVGAAGNLSCNVAAGSDTDEVEVLTFAGGVATDGTFMFIITGY